MPHQVEDLDSSASYFAVVEAELVYAVAAAVAAGELAAVVHLYCTLQRAKQVDILHTVAAAEAADAYSEVDILCAYPEEQVVGKVIDHIAIADVGSEEQGMVLDYTAVVVAGEGVDDVVERVILP